jgi:hypothetical protein
MNNVILRKFDVTDGWQPLAAVPLVGTITVSTPPTNSGNVLFRSVHEPGHEVPWVPGEWHEFKRIDLSSLQIKAAGGDGSGSIVTVVGGTW